jgi:hypothetical protein
MNRLQGLLKKKLFGIPMPVVLVVSAGAAYWWWSSGSVGGDPAAEAGDAMDPNEGADPGATGLVEPPATVVYQSYNLPTGGSTARRPCPRGYTWNGRKCVRKPCPAGKVRNRQGRCVKRRATGGGRGAQRTSTAGRVISARR